MLCLRIVYVLVPVLACSNLVYLMLVLSSGLVGHLTVLPGNNMLEILFLLCRSVNLLLSFLLWLYLTGFLEPLLWIGWHLFCILKG